MIPSVLAGALIIGVPAVIIAYLVLYRQPRWIFWFTVALILVGLGYLAGTGALTDIANAVLGDVAPEVISNEPSPIAP
jgi:hypothetical protein